MLFVFVCGIDVANIIGMLVSKHIERKEEKQILKEEKRKEREEYIAMRRKEMQAQRQEQLKEAKHNKENILASENSNQQISPEQIKINLNGRLVEEETKDKRKGLKGLLKKSKQEEVKPSIAQMASSIMQVDKETGEILEGNNNLFVQEEQQKEDKTKQVLQLEHTMAVEEDNYVFPPVDILSEVKKPSLKGGTQSLKETAARLQKTLYSFGVSAKVENVTVGPAITRYELKPAEGVRVSKIANLADDIALNLAAESIRIEAPIPGKQAVRN
jgi:DNA segregation ATPase FtsK/SpoIIIE-like protein